jgi:hypothetical protein
MELLRYGHDAWGDTVLNGVSWDLIPVAFWAGVAVIVAHLGYRAFYRRKARGRRDEK